jgi:hypothetical protein
MAVPHAKAARIILISERSRATYEKPYVALRGEVLRGGAERCGEKRREEQRSNAARSVAMLIDFAKLIQRAQW